MTEYRCSCCNKLVSGNSQVWKNWTQKVRPDKTKIVAICRKCNNQLKKHPNIIGVKEYLEWVIHNDKYSGGY